MALKKTYIVKLSQAGTNTPTAEVFKNTIGSLVWSRIDAGLYHLTLAGAFVSSIKTLPINYCIMNTDGVPVWLVGEVVSDDIYQISCLDESFTELDLHAIVSLKIEQYED